MGYAVNLVLFVAVSLLIDYGSSSVATNKLSLASWGSFNYRDHKGPGTYAYGYDITDPVNGNVQFRQEERHPNGIVTGSYGYVDAYGVPQTTHYIADAKGYRVLPNKPKDPSQAGIPQTAIPYQENSRKSTLQMLRNDRVQNAAPLMYELHGPMPFLTYYGENGPLPFIYVRK